MPKKTDISDTVHVTPDGAILVDASRLLDKPHIQEMMQSIRAKTKLKIVARKHAPETAVS